MTVLSTLANVQDGQLSTSNLYLWLHSKKNFSEIVHTLPILSSITSLDLNLSSLKADRFVFYKEVWNESLMGARMH